MNKNLYRLVFNARRGQMMAVAETAGAQGKSASGETSAHPDANSPDNSASNQAVANTDIAQTAIKVIAITLLSLPLLAPLQTQAQIRADASAPGNQQPQIITTGNGLPQVNIQAPSAAGVSRNVYSQFDVNAQGAILNNSRTNVQTQLGGWVQSNGNLAGGAARVILNEVNSSNPSQLKGFVEVAGQRAEVIIANPSGISVDGGGFINASGVTLTTGAAQINNATGGSLDSFRVQQGVVTINGAGLDTSSADFTRILARATQVNAGIWAKDLRVVTGSNEVNATTHAATAIAGTGAAPAFAIDVAALGGMYANKITLIGTEAGVGVNNAGTIAANGGDLVLQANGMLTNRGVLDGGATHIDATTVNNLGTGKIYGDRVSIGATTLNNDTETVAGTTSAGVIAARVGRLDIGAATVNNREHALLFSVGDLAIGGGLDANRQATGQAADVNNASATIEALGNVSIATNNLRNTNEHFAFEDRVTTVENGLTINNTGSYYAVINRTTYDPVITENYPAKILAGGDINLDTANALNRNSHIIAGGALNMEGAAITNEGTNGQHRVNDKGTSYTWTIVGQDCGWYNWSYRCNDRWDWRSAVYETNTYTTVTVSTGVSRNNTAPAGSGTTVPNSSLFRVATNTSYLVETDPRFTNQRTWLNSDFMLASLNLDPSLVQKRLGDGFYEQRMVREQVAQLTGRRFLGDYTSDQQEYQALMQSGVTVATAWNLRPGIALTAAQVAQLTADIVWLVEQEVTLPNGTKHMALVPQVYVRPQPGDLANTGALLAGKDVNINLSGDLTNSGTIAGRRVVAMNAQNIQNLGGSIQGDTVAVNASTDINNTGGTLQAQSALSAIAGRDLNVGTTTASSSTLNGISDSQRTIVDRVAGLYVTGGNGTLLASAGRDVNILAGIIGNSALDGSTTILASNNLNLGTVTTASSDNINWDERNYRRASNTAEVGSQISSIGTTTLSAGNNLTARAANVQSAGDMRATAGNNINISAGQATAQLSTGAYAESSGLLSSSSTEVRSHSASTNAIASNFSATRITGDSGQDLTVKGSNLTASQDVVLTAGRDVTIESAQNTSASANFRRETKSGFSVTDMGGLNYGNSKQSQDATLHSTTQVASTVSGANVKVQAGRDATIKASNVLADQDITVAAQRDINVLAAANTQTSTSRSESSSTTIGLVGDMVGRQTFYGTTANMQDGSQTAVSQSTSVLSANKGNLTLVAANAPLEAGPSTVGTVTTQGAELLAGKTVTIQGAAVDLQAIKDATSSLSHSESKTFTIGAAPAGLIGKAVLAISDNIALSQNTQNERLKGAAQLKAGYDAYKFANGGAKAAAAASAAPKGDPGSASIGISISVDSSTSSQDASASKTQSRGTNVQAKDIVIQATQGDITATAAKLQADNITLDAAKNVNLIAAVNLETNTSSNHSDSVGVGVTVGLGQNSGISFQLRAAQAQGRSNGTETTYDNTQVTATKNLTVKSGTDTNLIGAQLAAETVKMEVGTSGKGALNIETLQNTSTFKSEQSSSGFDMSLCIPPICYGVPVTVSVSVSQQAIDHNYISAVGQSGVAAGSGGFDIKVAGNTDLKGAAITSTASADKNTLETQSLTSSDLANAQSTSSSSSSITVGNNLTAMVLGNVLANLAGKDGLPENGSQNGKTLSVISPGAITITGTGNASTDATSGQQVALLTSRDASTANGALTNTLTLQQAQGLQAQQKEIQENMQAGQLVGSVAYNMAGDIAAKNQWAESSPQKIALHAIAGLIQASAAGRNGAAGALAGAANEALTKTVNDAIDKAMQLPANATPEQVRENAQNRKTLAEGAAQLIGMAAVALGGGSAQDVRLGGAVALNADRFNRQLHPTEAKLIKENAARYASQRGISVEKAEAELTQQAERNNDSAHAQRLGESDGLAQSFLQGLGAGKNMVDGLTGQTYQLFSADQTTRDNHAMFGQYAKTSPQVQQLLDVAYAKAYKPLTGQTIAGVNGSNAGALTGSDLALNDAARDYGNMRKQPAVVQWAVLGELRQERQGNLQNQLALTQELQQMNSKGDTSPAAANRRGEIINRLTQLDAENTTLRQASVEQLKAMGDARLLNPADQREWIEGSGAAIASSGLAFKGLSASAITGKLKMLGQAIDEVKAATAAAKTEAQAIASARIESNIGANSAPTAVELTFDKGTRTWTTPAGVDYGPGSVHGNRVQHVLDHAVPNPNKTTHSVFNVDRKEVLGLVDNAWLAKGNPLPNDPGAYVVPMGRVIGTAGETSIKIIVRPGTNKIITAYPFQ